MSSEALKGCAGNRNELLQASYDRKLLKSAQCCSWGFVSLLPPVLPCHPDGCTPLGSFPFLLIRGPGCLFCSHLPFVGPEYQEDKLLELSHNVLGFFFFVFFFNVFKLFLLLLWPCENGGMCLATASGPIEMPPCIYKTRS